MSIDKLVDLEKATQFLADSVIESALGDDAIAPSALILQTPDHDAWVVQYSVDKRGAKHAMSELGRAVAQKGMLPVAIVAATEIWVKSMTAEQWQASRRPAGDYEDKEERLMVAAMDMKRNIHCRLFNLGRDERGRFTAIRPVDRKDTLSDMQAHFLEAFYRGYAKEVVVSGVVGREQVEDVKHAH